MAILETHKKFSYQEYEKLPEGPPYYQIIEGELIMSPSAVPYHQKISRNIEFELISFIRVNDLGEVFDAPIDVCFSEEELFIPDILFISKERLNIIGEKRIEGSPDLVVEILSPSTAYYDLRHKKDTYEKFGVKEYWIVDPIEKSIEIYFLVDQKYDLHQIVKKEGKIRSKLLTGFDVELSKVF